MGILMREMARVEFSVYGKLLAPAPLLHSKLETSLITASFCAGLINELCEPIDVIMRAQKQAEKLAAVPATAFATNKRIFRAEALQRLRDNRELDIQNFVSLVQKPQTQKALEEYLQNLKRK